MKALLTASLAGVIFGVGLCLSGMTDPKNVLSFLDITGHWSPNLGGVMLGAIGVHAAWLRWGARRAAPSASHSTSARPRVDGALIAGAATFGVGWGLAGYCPGPSLVALGTGAAAPIVFVGAMLLGMTLSAWLKRVPAEALPASANIALEPT